jgi:sugar phosphate isomerase/epimerase
MFKLGLKLWSTNRGYFNDAVRMYDEGIYHYIELFAVPGSYDDTIAFWKPMQVPFLIHASHSTTGCNLSLKEHEAANAEMARESFMFADALNAPSVIFHPGIFGTIEETARQIAGFYDARILIENKPVLGQKNEPCVGFSPDEINFLMKQTGVKFCLDIGHAICAANSLKRPPVPYIQQLMELGPMMYHISDGDYTGVYDTHEHLGEVSYPFDEIIPLMPKDARITLETKKNSTTSLSDFPADVEYVKKFDGK